MAGKQKVAMALKVLQDALPLYGAGSEEGQAIVDCLRKLGKLAQPGEVSQAGQMNELQKRMLAQIQQGQMMKRLAQQGAPQAGGAPQTPPAAA